MPHEHINSSLVPRLPDGRAPERVVVGWTKPTEPVPLSALGDPLPIGTTDDRAPAIDARPVAGSVVLTTEWLVSEARWPSPKMVEVDRVSTSPNANVGSADPRWLPDAPGAAPYRDAVILGEGENTWSEPCTGFTVTLTREDVNHLITQLRRARDEAFGRDA